jgi:tetratricopeptide (TPR) repeat protein
LVFEDLHWADDNLLDFVDHLVDWASSVPLLVVSTARPELLTRRPGWGGGKPNALTVSLSSLSDEDTARLLAELLGSVLPAETQVELLARAGGNPLYAEEFARMLRDRGRVGELPETVQGLIAARLDLLEAEQKALLQDAAVIGKRFWLGALVSLSGIDRAGLEAGLHSLERKEFVRRERSSSVADDSEYGFRHLLVRDVAYGQIPRVERAQKHLLAASWIEQLGRREDHAEMLAHHYLQALELTVAAGGGVADFADAARVALADAGDRAFGLNAYDAAVRFFRAALDLVPVGDAHRGRLLLRLGRTLPWFGEPDAGVLDEASNELLAAGDTEGAVEAETALSELYWLEGDRDRAFERLANARRLADPLPPSAAKARATSMASRILMLASEFTESIRLGEQALAMASQLGLDEIKAATLNNVGVSRTAAGNDEGVAQIAEAIEVARAANAPFELVRAMGNLAVMYWIAGRLGEAHVLVRESLEESQRYGQRGFARWDRGILVQREYELGLWDDASAAADDFIAHVEAGSPHYLAAETYMVRAAIRLGRGEVEAPVEDASRALELARRAKDPQLLYQTLAGGAHVLHDTGDIEGATELAREFLSALEAGQGLGFSVSAVHVLAWTLVAAGQGPELIAGLEPLQHIPWARAGAAFGEGDPVRAADICAEMGAATQEAYARLAAARLLVGQGRRPEADEQLHRALAFYRSVGASRYVREGESLLAVTA